MYLSSTFRISFISETCVYVDNLNPSLKLLLKRKKGDCVLGNVRATEGGTQMRGKECSCSQGREHGLEKIF